MSLIKCDECGKDISDKSKKCINCGAPIKKKNKLNKSMITNNSINKTKKISKKHLFILIGICIGIICVVVFIFNTSGTIRKFTGKYKEFKFCEDDYKLIENQKCVYRYGNYEKKPTYEDINPLVDWDVEWEYISKDYHGVPYSYFVSDYILEEDFKNRDECHSVLPGELKEDENGKKVPISYRCTVLPSGTKAICPTGYVLFNDEDDNTENDMCIENDKIKEPTVYNMPIYEIKKEKELPGVTCSSRNDSDKEQCVDLSYVSERLLGGDSAKCKALNITKENIVISKCTVKDPKIIMKYESEELYVAILKTLNNYSSELGNFIPNYDYSTGIAPTWEEAIEKPLQWYKSH